MLDPILEAHYFSNNPKNLKKKKTNKNNNVIDIHLLTDAMCVFVYKKILFCYIQSSVMKL